MKKILIITPHFAPYRDDVFSYIEKTGKYSLKFLITKGNITHPEWNYKGRKFDYEQSDVGKQYGALGSLYDSFKELLKKYDPDIVITCGELIIVIYMKLFYRNKKVIFVSDQIRRKEKRYEIIRKAGLKFLYELTDGIWVTGVAGKKYFEQFVNPSKIQMGCYTNDIERILINGNKYKRNIERDRLGIEKNDFVFLFVGKLIFSREIEKNLAIANLLSEKRYNVKFLIVGDGPDANKVLTYMKREKNNVVYIPSIALEELEKVYVVSDAYLYLGWEPYSLALYEAAILGLPIIANAKVGAVYDCVKDGINGAVIDNFDLEYVVSKCIKAIEGAYSIGALDVKKDICENRGVEWAASQLMNMLE